MNLIEFVIVILVAAIILSAGATKYQHHRQEAALARELALVRDIALRYAAANCSTPPATAVTLATVRTALADTTTIVSEPARWQIRLIARPGWTQPGAVSTDPQININLPPAVSIWYQAQPTDWQNAYLRSQYNARYVAGRVEVAVHRRRAARPQSSFSLLLENRQC